MIVTYRQFRIKCRYKFYNITKLRNQKGLLNETAVTLLREFNYISLHLIIYGCTQPGGVLIHI